MRILSLGSVSFDGPGEDQLQWSDWLWQPVGQTRRYALAGNVQIIENARTGRPITLVAELPWAWLEAGTVSALRTLAATHGATFDLVVEDPDHHESPNPVETIYPVRFRRDGEPLELTPLDPRRAYYTGTIRLWVDGLSPGD